MKYDIFNLDYQVITNKLLPLASEQIMTSSMIDESYDANTKNFLSFIVNVIETAKEIEKTSTENNAEKISRLIEDADEVIGKYFEDNSLISYYDDVLSDSLERVSKLVDKVKTNFNIEKIKKSILDAIKTLNEVLIKQRISEFENAINSFKTEFINEFATELSTQIEKIKQEADIQINTTLINCTKLIAPNIASSITSLVRTTVPEYSVSLNNRLNGKITQSVTAVATVAQSNTISIVAAIKEKTTERFATIKKNFERLKKRIQHPSRVLKYFTLKAKRNIDRNDKLTTLKKYGAIGLVIKLVRDAFRNKKATFSLAGQMNFKPFRYKSVLANTVDDFIDSIVEHTGIINSNLKLYLDQNVVEAYDVRRRFAISTPRKKQRKEIIAGEGGGSWIDDLLSFLTSLPSLIRLFRNLRKLLRGTWNFIKRAFDLCWRVGKSLIKGLSRFIGRALEKLGLKYGIKWMTRTGQAMEKWGSKGVQTTTRTAFRRRTLWTKTQILYRRIRKGQWDRILHKRAWLRRWRTFKNSNLFKPNTWLNPIRNLGPKITNSRFVKILNPRNWKAGFNSLRTSMNWVRYLKPSNWKAGFNAAKTALQGSKALTKFATNVNPATVIFSFAIDGAFAFIESRDTETMAKLYGIDASEVGAQQRGSYIIAGTLVGSGSLLDADWHSWTGAGSALLSAAATTAKWAMVGALVGGPIGAAIGAGVGLVLSFIGTERLAKGINALCNGVKKAWGAIWSFTKTTFKVAWEVGKFLVNPIPVLWSGMKAAWKGAKALCSKVYNKLKSWKNKLVNVFSSIKNKIKEKLQNAINAVKEKVLSAINFVKNGVKNIINNIVNKVKDCITNIANKVVDKFKNAVEKFKNIVSGIKNVITKVFSKVKDVAKQIVGNIVKAVKFAFGLATKVRDSILNVLDAAFGVKKIAKFVVEKTKEAVKRINELVKKAIAKIKEKIKNIFGKFKNGLKHVAQKTKDVAKIAVNKSYKLTRNSLAGKVAHKLVRDTSVGKYATNKIKNTMAGRFLRKIKRKVSGAPAPVSESIQQENNIPIPTQTAIKQFALSENVLDITDKELAITKLSQLNEKLDTIVHSSANFIPAINKVISKLSIKPIVDTAKNIVHDVVSTTLESKDMLLNTVSSITENATNTVFSVLNSIQSFSPLSLATNVITGLGTNLISSITQNKSLINNTLQSVGLVTENVEALSNKVTNGITATISDVESLVPSSLTEVSSTVNDITSIVLDSKNVLSDIKTNVFSTVDSVKSNVFSTVTNVRNTVIDTIQTVQNNITQIVSDVHGIVVDASSVVTTASDLAVSGTNLVMSSMKDVSTITGAIGMLMVCPANIFAWIQLFSGVKNIAVNVFQFIVQNKDKILKLFRTVKKIVFSALRIFTNVKGTIHLIFTSANKIVKTIKGSITNIFSIITNAFNWVKNKFKSLFSIKKKIVDRVKLGANRIKGNIETVVSNTKSRINDIGLKAKHIKTAVQDVAKNGENVIHSVFDSFDGSVKNCINSVISAVKNFLSNNFSRITDMLKSSLKFFTDSGINFAKQSLNKTLLNKDFFKMLLDKAFNFVKLIIPEQTANNLRNSIESHVNKIQDSLSEKLNGQTTNLEKVEESKTKIDIALKSTNAETIQKRLNSTQPAEPPPITEISKAARADLMDIEKFSDMIKDLLNKQPDVVPIPMNDNEKESTPATIAADYWLAEDAKMTYLNKLDFVW